MNREVFLGLKKIPFLSVIADDVLMALAEKAKITKYPKLTTIILEGDQSSCLYIILSGKVRVFIRDEKNKEITLQIQEAGTYFGEIALLTDDTRSASVSTVDTTFCAVISKAEFISWLMVNPLAAIALMGVLSNKIRQLTKRIKTLALSNVYERTTQILQELAVAEGSVKVIYNRPTQQDLAFMVGASREMINKIMHELTKGGYIEIKDKILIIHKKLPSSW